MAYHSGTNSLAIVGHATDEGILGLGSSSITDNGFAVLLTGSDLQVKWVKGFIEPLIKNRMYHSAFSPDGAYLLTSLVYNHNVYLIILETSSGNPDRIFTKSDYLAYHLRASPHLLFQDSPFLRAYLFFDVYIPTDVDQYPLFSLVRFSFLPSVSSSDPYLSVDWTINSDYSSTG